MKTTLNLICDQNPCEDGWKKLLKGLGKRTSDDDPVSIADVLNCSGLSDALWCLRAVDGYEKEKRLYAVWCAKQIQHLNDSEHCFHSMNTAEKYAHGLVSEDDLYAANDDAWKDVKGDITTTLWATSIPDAGVAAYDAASASARVCKELVEAQEKELRRMLNALTAARAA